MGYSGKQRKKCFGETVFYCLFNHQLVFVLDFIFLTSLCHVQLIDQDDAN